MNPNDYDKQQKRAWSRKLELVNLMGGCCSRCGYGKNLAALEFHHTNPDTKSFQLDARHLSNTSMDKILEESKKCVLLCSNCHREIHNPDQTPEILLEKTYINKSLLEDKRKMAVCPHCGKKFPYVKGKIFCSDECRKESKQYPSRDEVQKKYKELKSQRKVAEYYGLTRKIVIGILNQ